MVDDALPIEGKFDAIEVLSGYWLRADARDALLTDWSYLLRRGNRVTAVAGSDSHKLNWVRAGWPLTWLRLPTEIPGEVTGAMLGDALKHQRAIVSSGPFIAITVDGGQIGDLVVPRRKGAVTVTVTVDAPQWIDVTTLTLSIDGAPRRTVALMPGRRPRFHGEFVERISADGFVVASVIGQKPLASDVIGEYRNPAGTAQPPPWAMTNPVFIDADGDGVWRPRPPEVRP